MNSNYSIWMFQNDVPFRFPFPPEEINFDSGGKNVTSDIDGLGESTTIKTASPLSFSIESHFPKAYFPGCEYEDLPDPLDAVALIQEWRKNPVRIIITALKINMLFTIEDFTYKESGGDVGSIYFTIKLKEYRQGSFRRVLETKGNKILSSNKKVRQSQKPQLNTYIVKKGDCLWRIAKKVLGSSEKWRDIAKTNAIDPKYVIYPGQKLLMPKSKGGKNV